MAGIKLTYLLCYDDHRSFTEDIRKRFSDSTRYRVESFHNAQDFMDNIRKEKVKNSCKVAIIGVPDAREQFEMIGELTMAIKKVDQATGLILLIPPDKMEDLKKAVRFNIDAYIPRNDNSVLRIHNAVKKLISEQSIVIFRKRRNISVYVLLGFLVLAGLLVLIARFRLPQYF
jgi:DNA-binding NarL/FixJ family response regulator